MLEVTVPDFEGFDERTSEFVYMKGAHLTLEHSLISISKWESKWKRPFLSKEKMTNEQTIDYIRCMTLTKNVDPTIYNHLPYSVIKQIIDYIDDPMTATTVSETPGSHGSREVVTSELIYYWMTALQIPFECQKWNLNRLMMLIRVCNAKNAPPKKMSKGELMKRNNSLNAARRAKLGSKG